MSNKLLLLVSFLGMLVSGYLLITYVSPLPLVCGADGGCSVVQASVYVSLLGVPTPLYGVAYYLVIGILVSLWKQDNRVINQSLKLFTVLGLAFSAWLTYLEAFVINAWCVWCVISAILATAAFLLVWIKSKKEVTV